MSIRPAPDGLPLLHEQFKARAMRVDLESVDIFQCFTREVLKDVLKNKKARFRIDTFKKRVAEVQSKTHLQLVELRVLRRSHFYPGWCNRNRLLIGTGF